MLLEPSSLRSAAGGSLERANRPGRVILIHTGAILLISLLLTVADHLLNRQISTTGGLSGMGMRSVLTTVQSMLRLLQAVVLPFWQTGYTYYTLKVAQEQSAGTSNLFEGFRRFGPVLRLKVLIAGMVAILVIVCINASSILFMLTPWAAPMMQKMQTLLATNPDEQMLWDAMVAMAMEITVPVMIIFGLCLLIGGSFLFFRFRLAERWLMDHPQGGALAALLSSHKLMKGNWKALLRIDLSFWWFYLLEVLVTVLCYGDVVLGAMGVEMTTDAFGSYILFFVLYLCAQLALYWWKRNDVAVTYAHAYLALCPEEEPQETTKV